MFGGDGGDLDWEAKLANVLAPLVVRPMAETPMNAHDVHPARLMRVCLDCNVLGSVCIFS